MLEDTGFVVVRRRTVRFFVELGEMQEKLWIKATNDEGDAVWINMTEVRQLQPDGEYTHVYFDKEDWVSVTETPKELLAKIGITAN
jgi:hypothetical protein